MVHLGGGLHVGALHATRAARVGDRASGVRIRALGVTMHVSVPALALARATAARQDARAAPSGDSA